MRYKPWGEIRYSWTSNPATTPAYQLPNYTFTGQYSYMDDPSTAGVTEGFGLMFYNARWYDPSLGRFAQADTIVPPGVQGLDRYAYANNSPVKFIDPLGHITLCGEACENQLDARWNLPLSSYGVVISRLTSLEVVAIGIAVRDYGKALAATTPGIDTPAQAFQLVMGVNSNNPLKFERCPEGYCSKLGWTRSSKLIWFNYFVYSRGAHPADWWQRTVHVVVHELTHVFNARMSNLTGKGFSPYDKLDQTQTQNPAFPNRIDNDPRLTGFAGPRYNWQQSPDGNPGEEFADMGIGWTYNTWEIGDNGLLSDDGRARSDWMNTWMPFWVNLVAASEGGMK